MFKYLGKNIKSPTSLDLHPNIKKVLENLCSSNKNTQGDTIELYDHFGFISPGNTRSIFSPPYETVIRVRKEILPSLSLIERKNVEGIGIAMRKHIDKDIAYLKKNYSW
jgi:hypothetical protein